MLDYDFVPIVQTLVTLALWLNRGGSDSGKQWNFNVQNCQNAIKTYYFQLIQFWTPSMDNF